MSYPSSTPHLNAHGLVIRSHSETGRGVYATHDIPRNIVVEISPVLLFKRDEYSEHGRHTALDSYTFIWKDKKTGVRSWALALGLGSLFNHSSTPNVSFNLDYDRMCIRYTTSRPIKRGEQLFICYGREEDMWWNQTEEVRMRKRKGSFLGADEFLSAFEVDQDERETENEGAAPS